ncbi:MAG: DUF3298 domain-containing protein [Clostridia bacterium]|nr:DUF3298 domain-containing protein [Clostridia bacterium]
MKKLLSLLLAFALAACLCGCGEAPDTGGDIAISLSPSADAQDSVSSAAGESASVEDYKEYRSGAGKVVMTSAISYERLQDPSLPEISRANINIAISTYAQNLRNLANLRGNEAIADHAADASLAAYYETQDILLAHACEKSVSYLVQSTVFTGGMHAIDTNTALSFDAQTGKQLTLDDVFDVDSTVYLPRLHAEVKRIIDNEKLTFDPLDFLYYENYAEALYANTFADKWYLGDETLYLIYQPYEIAPYTAGVITFSIPYSALADILEGTQVG